MKLEHHADFLNYFRAFVDFLAVSFAWFIAFGVRFQSGLIPAPLGQESSERILGLWLFVILVYGFVFVSQGTYNQKIGFSKTKVSSEHGQILSQHVMAFLSFSALSFFLLDHHYSRLTLVIFFIFTPCLIAIGRSMMRKINRVYLKKSRKKMRVAILGTGPQVDGVTRSVIGRQDWNVSFSGHYSLKESDCFLSDLKHGLIDVAFIVPSATEMPYVESVYVLANSYLLDFFLVPYMGESHYFAPRPVYLDGVPTVAVNAGGLSLKDRAKKRCFDLVFSLLFIFVFSPVFFVCALLVYFSSPGPILYKQERMGLDGKKFLCLKFRGMYADAESKTGPVWAKAGDDRTTSIGKWLRKTSLDEIPQFFNVLRGDMSVVGPRPERPVFVDNFRNEIPGYILRHKMKAGITGYAQINGWRGQTSLEKRIECDLFYIQNWSLWLDLKIVLLTPIKSFTDPHAY